MCAIALKKINHKSEIGKRDKGLEEREEKNSQAMAYAMVLGLVWAVIAAASGSLFDFLS